MNTIKKIAAVLSVIVLTAGTSFAGNVNRTSPAIGEEPSSELLKVNYIGEDANYIYFKVALKKGNNTAVALQIADAEEGELYSAVYKTDKEQTLKIEKRNNQQIEFNLTAGKKSYTKSFTVVPTVVLDKQ